jgi:hemolysin activation/secretion protein
MRYAIPFKPFYKPLTQEVTWGFDYKNTNTNLFFIGDLDNVPVVTKEVNLTQLYLGYTLEDKKKHNELVFNLEGFYSPGQWLPHQTNQDYNNLRAHAKNRYFYAHLSIKDVAKFKHHLSLAGLLRLQGATGTLLPSETFGLGGYDTVRGYDEREVIADNALCANLELRYNVKRFTFLAFSDYGLGYNYHPLSGQHHIEQLVSVGPGLRYIYSPYITARLDYGFQLHHTDLGENRFGKFHVGLVLSY